MAFSLNSSLEIDCDSWTEIRFLFSIKGLLFKMCDCIDEFLNKKEPINQITNLGISFLASFALVGFAGFFFFVFSFNPSFGIITGIEIPQIFQILITLGLITLMGFITWAGLDAMFNYGKELKKIISISVSNWF